MKEIQRNNINRILIRSSNWIGDAVMTTPAIRAIRLNFPGAEISILAKPWVAPIYENNSHIDRILICRSDGRHGGFAGIFRLARDLRKEKFDLAFLLPNSFETAFVSFLAGISMRAGYDTDCRKFFLTHPVRLKSEYKRYHQIDYYLMILKQMGLRAFGTQQTLVASDAEKKVAWQRFQVFGVAGGSLLIGINPGAAFGTAKRWFPDRYAALARKLITSFNAHIAIFGSPGEKKLGEYITGKIGQRCVNLCGKTTLREAISAISVCDLFITNDSGLMHVAAALDIPQIAVFGSTDSVATSPASPSSRIIQDPIECNPCLKPECPKGNHLCMKNITVDMVFDVARRLLNEKPGTTKKSDR